MAASVINYHPRTEIQLYGFLGRKYGKTHTLFLDRGDPREAAKALDVNLPGFAKDLIDAAARGIRFAVFKNGKNIGEEDLDRGGARVLRFAPVITGSKRAGLLQTIVGVALIVASFFVAPGSQAAFLGAGIGATAGGVIQMLSPQAGGLSQSAAPENLPSYAFGSAKNTTASGNPVPICIGKRRWGGAIISASIEAQDKS
ncbi:Bacteriophage lambda tail assembly protein I [compost metagenome]